MANAQEIRARVVNLFRNLEGAPKSCRDLQIINKYGAINMSGHKNRTPGSIGCENLLRLAVSAALLTLTACGGGSGTGESDENWLDLSNLQGNEPQIGAATDNSLIVETDVAETIAGDSITVAVLSNDSFNAAQRMRIVGEPENGTVELLSTGELKYTANADFEGSDSVDYVLVDSTGNEAVGTLYLSVLCSTCELAPSLATHAPGGEPYCVVDTSDPDGDGFGWENEASCAVRGADNGGGLAAKADSFDVAAGSVRTVSPLRNDSITDRSTVEFQIDSQPAAGELLAVEAGLLVYSAPADFTGTDQVMYSITDASGNSSSASIDFNVACEGCIDYKALRLSWPANPEGEQIDGYRVFFGPDENTHTASLLSEVSASSFADGGPSVVYDLAADLNISNQEGGCFRIQAYRGAEVSEQSEPACFTKG